MSLNRFTWENRTHRTTGIAPLIILSGEATGYMGDVTGISREMAYHWNREINKRYYVTTHTSLTGKPFTGSY